MPRQKPASRQAGRRQEGREGGTDIICAYHIICEERMVDMTVVWGMGEAVVMEQLQRYEAGEQQQEEWAGQDVQWQVGFQGMWVC